MAAQSLFSTLKVAGQLLEVPMDGVDIYLPGSGKQAIGTRGLNGCSCVVIMGSTAIVLAHVSPFPGQGFEVDYERDLNQESYQHHEDALKSVADLITEHKSHFPLSSTAWGIFGWSKEEGHLISVKNQIQSFLKNMGYEMKPAFYEQMNAYTIVPPKGELVGLIRNNVAELYLEKKKLWPIQQQYSAVAQSPISTAASSTSGSGPAESRWDGQYYVSTRNPDYVWINNTWVRRPSTASTATASASKPSVIPPAESRWDGQYYVSTRNPDYVWINGTWNLKR